VEQLEASCLTTPTQRAVDEVRERLLNSAGRYPPAYEEAVRGALDDFLTGRPRKLAHRFRTCCRIEGVEAAVTELARITGPIFADPLTAARTLQHASGQIIAILQSPDLQSKSNSITMLGHLAAIVDNATRTAERGNEIARIASAFPKDRLGEAIWHSVAEQGIAPTLWLEKICQLCSSGETDLAELELRETLLPAVEGYYQLVSDDVQEFFDLAATFLSPLFNWAEALRGKGEKAPLADLERTWGGYCAELSTEAADIESGFERLQLHGFNLVRLAESLRTYAPQFEALGLDDELESRAEAFIDDEIPELAFALSLSDLALSEGIRAANTRGLLGGDLHIPSSVLSWNLQTLSIAKSQDNLHRLRLLRRDGGRTPKLAMPGWPASAACNSVMAVLTMYATGEFIGSSYKPLYKQANDPLLKLLTLYAEVRIYGERILNANGLAVAKPAEPAIALHKVLSPGAHAALVAASLVDRGADHDRSARSTQTEPYNRLFLIQAGVPPPLADHLATNDREGISCAARLQAWSALNEAPFHAILQWLTQQDVCWVGEFVNCALLPVEADQNGRFPSSENHRNLEKGRARLGFDAPVEYCRPLDMELPQTARFQDIVFARTLMGISEWAHLRGRPLPD
jgi:hypothetical protein